MTSDLLRGGYIDSLAGVRLTFSPYALEATNEPNFPASRHRSKRIHKKLLKRHGYKKVPCIWRTPHGIVAHSSFEPRLRAALRARGA
jgi:hypothetical protein